MLILYGEIKLQDVQLYLCHKLHTLLANRVTLAHSIARSAYTHPYLTTTFIGQF